MTKSKIMTKSIVSTLLAALIFQFLLIAPTRAQSSDGAEATAKIKAVLMKRGAGEKSKAVITLRDGRKLKVTSPN